MAGHYKARPGWASQIGQQGGKPAVATYRDGELRKVRYLVGDKEKVPQEALARVPTHLHWQGKRGNFRVLGQVRREAFEAIAVVMPDERVLITNLADSAIHPHGFDTPSSRTRMKRGKKLAAVSVITTIYSDRVVIAWYHRERSKLLKRIKLERI